MSSDLSAMILAAGFGTRLLPFTAKTPKPLLPFFDVPLIDFVLHRVLDAGIGRIAVNVHHLGDQVESHVRDFHAAQGGNSPFELHVSREDEILGTGGGIAQASPFFENGPVLVVNSDIFFSFDLKRLVGAHRRREADATLLIHRGDGLDHLRSTTVSPDGTVTAIEKADPAARHRGVFAGAYILEPSVYSLLPRGHCSVIGAGLHPAIGAGQQVVAVKEPFAWHDLGTWDAVLEAHKAVLSAPDPVGPYREVLRHSPGRFFLDARAGGIAPPSYVGPEANIEGQVGPLASVGRGAAVGAMVEVKDCVLMPGACATANCCSSVLL